jgi:hypothetical protein
MTATQIQRSKGTTPYTKALERERETAPFLFLVPTNQVSIVEVGLYRWICRLDPTKSICKFKDPSVLFYCENYRLARTFPPLNLSACKGKNTEMCCVFQKFKTRNELAAIIGEPLREPGPSQLYERANPESIATTARREGHSLFLHDRHLFSKARSIFARKAVRSIDVGYRFCISITSPLCLSHDAFALFSFWGFCFPSHFRQVKDPECITIWHCLPARHRGLQLQAVASRRLIQNMFHVWVGLLGFPVVIHNSDRMSCAYVDVAEAEQ